MRRLLVIAVAALVVTAVAAAAPSRAKVGLRATSLGRVLVDARGRTLYAFDLDKGGKSSCSGACAALWPPLLTSGAPRAAGVPTAKLGTVKRSDGRLQVTFSGHPLYVFAKDTKAGQVNGASIAHWAALTASGAKARPSSTGGGYAAPAPPPPTSTDPGAGYGGDYYP
jgi:predicted lipoprotein with Yx(FWY)xxD motif